MLKILWLSKTALIVAGTAAAQTTETIRITNGEGPP